MSERLSIHFERDGITLDLDLALEVEQTTLEHPGGIAEIEVLPTSTGEDDDIALDLCSINAIVHASDLADDIAQAVYDAWEGRE